MAEFWFRVFPVGYDVHRIPDRQIVTMHVARCSCGWEGAFMDSYPKAHHEGKLHCKGKHA